MASIDTLLALKRIYAQRPTTPAPETVDEPTEGIVPSLLLRLLGAVESVGEAVQKQPRQSFG